LLEILGVIQSIFGGEKGQICSVKLPVGALPRKYPAADSDHSEA
jgi:hypothetical protein